MEETYSEIDFVAYALEKMDIEVLNQYGSHFELIGGFSVEVEKKDLYKLSSDGWVISPFNDIGAMIEFIKRNI